MKLTQLELLVVSLRAQSGITADPNITFYKTREDSDGAALEGESNMFIEFDFEPTRDVTEMVWENKVVISSAACRSQKGDFNLPLVRVPFYAI